MIQKGSLTFILAVFFALPLFVYAGTIDGTSKYARFLNSSFGLINFGTAEGGVVVGDSTLTGYAWGEYVGWINLSPTNGGVLNDGSGNLSGYAWGEQTGWVNFDPTNGGVTIDSNGDFHGYAWSETRGWIVFNCTTDSTCGTLSHKVKTDWVSGSSPQCNNSLDDDGDGKTDFPADAGCTGLSDTDETGPFGGGITPPPSLPPTPLPPTPLPPVNPPLGETPPPSLPPESLPPPGGDGEPPEPPQNNGQEGGFPVFTNGPGGSTGGGIGGLTSFLADIKEGLKNGLIRTAESAQEMREEVKKILETPEGEITSKTITAFGVVSVSTASLLPFFFTPFSLSELPW